jgi:hypothetical protein
VYGREFVVPTEFITPSLYIAQVTYMIDDESVLERVSKLMDIEEAIFLIDIHQTMERDRHKSLQYMHIKEKVFSQGDHVLLYYSKYEKHPWKLQFHWLGPIIFVEIQESGVVKMVQLDGILHPGWVNGARLKPNVYAHWNKICNTLATWSG